MILQGKQASKATKKLNMVASSSSGQRMDLEQPISSSVLDSPELPIGNECTVLDPELVSKTLSEIEENHEQRNIEMDCSVILSSQVC